LGWETGIEPGPGQHSERRLDGTLSKAARCGKEEKIFPAGNKTLISQPSSPQLGHNTECVSFHTSISNNNKNK